MKSIKTMAAGILMFATFFSASAQDKVDNTNSKAVSFGIKGGVNFSTITGVDGAEFDSRTSFHAGAVVEVPVVEMFSVQFEALYSAEGFKSVNVTGSDGDRAELQLDYVNVPVLAKIYLFKGFSVEAGPQIGFKVRDKYEFNPSSSDGTIDLSDTPFDAEDFVFSVAGGLTFQTEMGLFASGRYNYGVTETFTNSDINGHNSNFQVSLGYKF